MKIVIAGASGLVGKALCTHLEIDGHTVFKLHRTKEEGKLFWDPEKGYLEPGALEEMDAVINLAGENIAAGRWTEEHKKNILQSRVKATRLIAETLVKLQHPPKVWINASAIGYYGDRGEEPLTESSSSGTGFLAKVCRQWEAATEGSDVSSNGVHPKNIPLTNTRIVRLRIGAVLSEEGGALKKMLLPFKLGLGGIIGSGEQYISWITLDDLVRVISFCLTKETLKGPVNAVTPSPVTNRTFTRTLGSVLHRPTIVPLPAFIVKTAFGEMGQELLLSSTRVLPEQLQNSGFTFAYPDLKNALEHLLKGNQ